MTRWTGHGGLLLVQRPELLTEDRMSDFQCNQQGCENPGVWTAMIRIWASNLPQDSHDPIVMPFPLRICEEHKATLGIDDFMDDAGFDYISHAMQSFGKAALDRSTAKLSWIPLPQEMGGYHE